MTEKSPYPLKLKPLHLEKLWGGQKLAALEGFSDARRIGERWDVACHEDKVSLVANGFFKDLRFDEVIRQNQRLWLGNSAPDRDFPLLIKLIDAASELSLQVHPTDEYAKVHEGQSGKTEAWYVLEAEPGAEISLGLKAGCTLDEFSTAAAAGKAAALLHRLPVKRGDFFCIESGLVHGIGAGVLLLEIQQNSDLTYRIDDYGRGRELHLAKALQVIKPSLKVKGAIDKTLSNGIQALCHTEHFSLYLWQVAAAAAACSDRERFQIITCVEGNGLIESASEQPSVSISYGESVFIPACLGEYKLKGKMKVIKSYPRWI